MIICIKKNVEQTKLNGLFEKIKQNNLDYTTVNSQEYDLVVLTGDLTKVDAQSFSCYDFVDCVKVISEPYKLASRKFKNSDTVVNVGGTLIGGGNYAFIGGPCAVESQKQIISIAQSLKLAGATMLRGGAFKPRTSPYSFQGLETQGLKMLVKAKEETGLKIVSEITSERQIDYFTDIDLIQIGARNMQNYQLIKLVASLNKPVLLKRGAGATIEEWLLSAEYLLSEGLKDVILCERGIKTFEQSLRATLDLSSLALVKSLTHLPVIVDPSHALGTSKFVTKLGLAGICAGSDGIMAEVHNDSKHALSDGAQAITPDEFAKMVAQSKQIINIINN